MPQDYRIGINNHIGATLKRIQPIQLRKSGQYWTSPGRLRGARDGMGRPPWCPQVVGSTLSWPPAQYSIPTLSDYHKFFWW